MTCDPLAESLDPLAVPTHQLREFLFHSLRYKDMATLAKRRPTMAPWASPFDHWATFRLLRSSTYPESSKAALRALLAGGSVTGAQSHHWTGDNRCPHCPGVPDSFLHRTWECPRYHHTRSAIVGPDVGSLVQRLPAATRSCLLLPGPSSHTGPLIWAPPYSASQGRYGLMVLHVTHQTHSFAEPLGLSVGRSLTTGVPGGGPRPARYRGAKQ